MAASTPPPPPPPPRTTNPPPPQKPNDGNSPIPWPTPTITVSTTLTPPTLSLSSAQPYPPVTLALTLTLAATAPRPVTLSVPRGVLDGAKHRPRHAPFLALVGTGPGGNAGERPERSGTAVRERDRGRGELALDARRDLVELAPGGSVVREFVVSGYDERATQPVGPGERRVQRRAWWVAGTALGDLRVDEGYEVEVLLDGEGRGGLVEWWEWGTVEEVVRKYVRTLGRKVGMTRFRAPGGSRWRGYTEGMKDASGDFLVWEQIVWEEGERGRIRLVE